MANLIVTTRMEGVRKRERLRERGTDEVEENLITRIRNLHTWPDTGRHSGC
jgi:hypothetical protein